MKGYPNVLKSKNNFRLLLLVFLLGINACTNQTEIVPSTVQAEEIISGNSNPYYTGIALEVEIDRLNEGDLDIVEIVSEIDDLRDLPQVVIYEDTTGGLILFECHISYHSGSRIGSYTRYRVCSIGNDSDSNVIAEGIYQTAVLPDKEWIALVGSQVPFHRCEHQIYMMQVNETILYPLIAESVFAHQRFCAINNLEWQAEDEVYQLSFSAWTGSDYPYHQLIFDAENMNVRLMLDDNTLFEHSLSVKD